MDGLCSAWLCLTGSSEDYPSQLSVLLQSTKSNEFKSLSNEILHSVKYISEGSAGHTVENVKNYLATAIYYLHTFVYENFLGIQQSESAINLEIFPNEQHLNFDPSVDGEPVNVNVSRPELLIFCRFILEQLLKMENLPIIVECWYIRYLYIHQKILQSPAMSLYLEFSKHSKFIVDNLNKSIDCVQTKAGILLEIVQGYLLYKRIDDANSHLKMIKDLLQVQFITEGVLGKRTKYQQKALPQMLLRVKSTSGDLAASNDTSTDTILPPLLQLNDDLRLERITFESEEDNKIFALPSIVQMLVLAEIKYIQLSQPKDQLADEEIQPYLTTLLHQQNGPWTCRIAALLENIQLEKSNKRTVDRSLKQCEEVVRLIDKEKSIESHQRFSFAFSSYLVPRWTVKSQFGKIMISLGLIKSALDVYLSIKKWDDIIACYNQLELPHKAAEVIEQELEKKPTVELYCLLGDAKKDPNYYQIAWEFSKQRSGRAQRDWGFYFFGKHEYEAAIPHLEKSVEINSLQEDVWIRLGFAAISLKNWELAVTAYKRYTYIEPNGFESWNNLAKAYVNLGEKEKAHKVLQEALKCNFNNWKVWENFMIVSIDTGHYEDVINSFNQLIELKGKYYDNEVLTILVKSIVHYANGQPTDRLLKKSQSLVSHLCVQHPHTGSLWELAAMLYEADPLSKARKLQKAYQCYTQTQSSWSKSPDTCKKVLEVCTDLCRVSIDAFDNRLESWKQAALSQLSSARLSAQGATRAARVENWDECKELVESLETLLDTIKDLLIKG